MKNKLMKVLCLSLAITGMPLIAQASVPVIDASNIAKQVLILQENYKQFTKMQQQLNKAKQQYEQFRGSRDIGALFNQYGQYLPAEMQSMYRDYHTGNWEGLANKVEQMQGMQNPNATQKQMIEDEIRAAFENKVKLDDMFKQSTQRFEQIQRMANSVDVQNDPKAAADLLNRIQVENAMLTLQTNQLQMAAMLRKAEQDLQRNQRLERSRSFNDPSNTKRRASVRAFQ